VLLGTRSACCPASARIATISMLLPITFACRRSPALIMLSGIFYGAQYGGSTTAILINLPGEASSVVTALDGYQMARQGRAGPALTTRRWALSLPARSPPCCIALLSPPLAAIALKFGPPNISR
jgi:putative tricarboxylic transport membrane protein